MSRTTGRECSEGDCMWLAPKVGAPSATSDRKPSDYECAAKTSEWPDCPRAMRAERDALRSALEWCAERVFQGCDIDGGDFQDEMVERGIMVSEPAPDEWKIEWDADKWFVLAWLARGGK